MPMDVWPGTLPQCFLVAGYGESERDGLIRDDYEVGPPIYRRRTTAAPAPYMGEMFMTTAEWETLAAFFHTTLFDGVLRFLFPPQGSTDTARFWISRFVSPPSRRMSDVDDGWMVSLSLERLGIGEVFLSPSAFSDPTTIYAPRIIYDQFISPARHTNTNTIYAPRAALNQFLTAGRHNNTNTIYAASALSVYIAVSFAEVEATTNQLGPSLLSSTNTFYAPNVKLHQFITPARYNNSNTFYAASTLSVHIEISFAEVEANS